MSSSILGKIGTAASNMRSGFLSVCGLGSISAGVWVYWHPLAGCVATGISLLLIDFAREKTPPEMARR